MSIASQALHLLRYDVLRMRWWLAALMTSLMLAALSGLELFRMSPGVGEMLPLLVVFVGMVSTLIVVQADSPSRLTAFSRAHAIAPLALLMAKTLFVTVFVVLVPLAVTGAALMTLDLSMAVVGELTATSLSRWSIWIAISALIGVVSGDSKSAVLLFISAHLGALLWDSVPPVLPSRVGNALRVNATLMVFPAIAVCLVLVSLRKVGRRSSLVVATMLSALGVNLLAVHTFRVRAASPEVEVHAAPAMEISQIDLQGRIRDNGAPSVWVRLPANVPGVRYSLIGASLIAYLANGDSLRFALDGSLDHPDPGSLVSLPIGLVWRGAFRDARHNAMLSVNLSETTYAMRTTVGENAKRSLRADLEDLPAKVKRLRSDSVLRIRVEATLNRSTPNELVTTPLAEGELYNRGGRRLSLTRRSPAKPGSYVASWSSLLLSSDDVYGGSPGDTRYSKPYLFVLQNRDREEAVSLRQSGRSISSDGFILPGLDRQTILFDLDGAETRDRNLDDAWLKGATLRVIRWKSDGAVSAAAERTLVP